LVSEPPIRDLATLLDQHFKIYTMLFPPCYPAWEMMEGENVKAYAKTFTSPLPKAAHPFLPFVGTCAAALKALTNLFDIRSKPWVFVTFGPSQK